MMLRNPNTITGCIIVLQIEHIGLEFNIKLSPFLLLSGAPAWPNQAAGSHEGVKGGVASLS